MEEFTVLYKENDVAALGTIDGKVKAIQASKLETDQYLKKLLSDNIKAVDASEEDVIEAEKDTLERIKQSEDKNKITSIFTAKDFLGQEHWITASFDPTMKIWIVWSKIIF